jgi:chromosomal replication initiation ATPase DnaA
MANPNRRCRICKKGLSIYNKTGICFHGHKKKENQPKFISVKVQEKPDADKIVQYVSEEFDVILEEIFNHQREGNLNLARQIAMYLVFNDAEWIDKKKRCKSILSTAEYFLRDHKTIFTNLKRLEKKMENNPTLMEKIMGIRTRYLR